MSEDLQCVNAHPVTVDGQTVVNRCHGRIVSSTDSDGYMCSDEGKQMVYPADVVELYEASPLWHNVTAVQRMLAKITALNPAAYNSTYPWIDLPLNHTYKAVVETSGGWWNVHFHRDGHPIETQPVDVPSSSSDTEAIAARVAQILADKGFPGK